MTSKVFIGSPESYTETNHTATDRTPYTYLIGWSNHDKWYYGCRTAKGCHPTDFWKKYFTSSKYVKKFREEHGEPDVIQIRRVFDNIDECVKWESRVLRKLNVIQSTIWLNLSINDGKFYTAGRTTVVDGGIYISIPIDDHRFLSGELKHMSRGYKHSEETKQKNSIYQSKRCSTIEFSNKMREINIGRVHSTETKNKQAEKRRGYKVSDETKAKISKSLTGGRRSDESKAKMSAKKLGKKHTSEHIKNRTLAVLNKPRRYIGYEVKFKDGTTIFFRDCSVNKVAELLGITGASVQKFVYGRGATKSSIMSITPIPK